MDTLDDLTTENDFVKRVRKKRFKLEQTITFKNGGGTFEQHDYDWYIQVAIEKADKVKEDRHLLTRELILGYRWAIREGYNHQLDPALRNQYDYPRNHNTIKGIQGYIDRIKKLTNK